MERTTFLFAEHKNLAGLVEALRYEDFHFRNAKVFINSQFIAKLSESADKESVIKAKNIKEIIWDKKCFIDYDIEKSDLGQQIYRINLDGNTIFLERGTESGEVIIIE